MICKERLPRAFRLTFIFISGLIFTQSLTLANDTANCTRMMDEDCNDQDEFSLKDINCADVYVMNSSGIMEFCHQHSFAASESPQHLHQHLPPELYDFNFHNIKCIVDMKNHLHCFWSITNLPINAKYFAYVSQDKSNQQLNCSHMVEEKAVECHGDLKHSELVVVKVNISLPMLWFVIAKGFNIRNIKKLDPPLNIKISKNLKNLEINWTLPEGEMISTYAKCHMFELKINDEVINLADGHISYVKQNIDLTRKYAIQIRGKSASLCSDSIYWSDWSSVYEVGPYESTYSVNPWVIAVIAFVLPMFLLAVLLLCKFQRLPKKLFPPIPNPSVNVKALLERDNYFQDFSSSCVERDGCVPAGLDDTSVTVLTFDPGNHNEGYLPSAVNHCEHAQD